ANPNMEAYPQPAATWIPLLESLPPATDMPTRVRMLQRAKPGFAQPPPACLAGLLHDHEPQIRRAAANLLSGSSEPTVLKLANELASDADPGVRQAAANSIITFRPQPPAEALSAMCEDPRWEAWHRANAWTQRFQRPGKDLIEASKRQFVKKDCEPFVLQAIAGGLANAGEQSWVIERITGLDPTVQASVLLRLLSHADNRVLDAVQVVIVHGKEPEAARMVSGLASATKEIDVFPLLLRCLSDKRSGVRMAAQRTIEQRASRPTPRATDQGKDAVKPDAEAERIAAVWRNWYTTHRAPLDAAGELALAAAARGDQSAPLPAVLRWLGRDGEAGVQAMQTLLASPLAQDERVWLALLRDPQFAQRSNEISVGLADCTPSPALQQAVLDRLAGGETTFVETACAWRSEFMAARLTELVVIKGVGWYAAKAELAAWWPQQIDTTVRNTLAIPGPKQPRPPYDVLQRAVALVVLRAELNKDAASIAPLFLRTDIDQSQLMPSIVLLAGRGDATASGILVKAISAKAQPVATNAALQGLLRQTAEGRELPTGTRDQIRRLAVAGNNEVTAEARAMAIALLAAIGDPTAPDLVHKNAIGEAWATISQPLLSVPVKAALPSVRELLALAPNQMFENRCSEWIERYAQLSLSERNKLHWQSQAARLEAADKLRGKPVDGLSAAIVTSGDLHPERDGTAKITITLTNHRREIFVLTSTTLQVSMELEGYNEHSVFVTTQPIGTTAPIRIAPNGVVRLPAVIPHFPDIPAAARASFTINVATGLNSSNTTMIARLPTEWIPVDLMNPAMRMVETNAGLR
ncbi:MAG: HEAT repeat domain-containing protein, partial [Planctomycetota bacterium]